MRILSIAAALQLGVGSAHMFESSLSSLKQERQGQATYLWLLIGGTALAFWLDHLFLGLIWVFVLAAFRLAGNPALRLPRRIARSYGRLAPNAIVRSRVPTYDFVIPVPIEPDGAARLLCGSFARARGFPVDTTREGDSQGTGRLQIRPIGFLSPYPLVRLRVDRSVAGSNVYVQLRVQVFWWSLGLGLVTWMLSGAILSYVQGVVLPTFLVALSLVLAVLAVVVWGLRSAQRIAISAIAGDVELE